MESKSRHGYVHVRYKLHKNAPNKEHRNPAHQQREAAGSGGRGRGGRGRGAGVAAPSARAALARDNACTLYATAAHCCAIHCCRHTVKLPHLPHCIVAAVAITLLRPRCCCQHALRLPRHILAQTYAQTSLAGSSHTFKPSNFGACLPRSPELKRNREAGKPHTFAPTPLFVGSNAFSCFPSQSALSR